VSDERQRMNPTLGVASSPAAKSAHVIEEACIPIQCDVDIIGARQQGRNLALRVGFSPIELTLIATAISELARNIVLYAKQGEIILKLVNHQDKKGIVVIARDQGPGIGDIRQALQDGYSTSRSLGLGLPGVRRLMDEFEIQSQIGQGTTVVVRKWTLGT
jgi:serine/threonine-protein kinase RsbT